MRTDRSVWLADRRRGAAGGPVHELEDGSILFSQAAPHLNVRFAGPAGAARVIASDPRLLPAIGDDFIQTSGSGDSRVQRFSWFFPQSKAVFDFPDGRILNVIGLHERQRSVWEVYEGDGRRVLAQETPRAYEPWAVAPNGDLFASYRDPDTDEHRIVRLRVRLEGGDEGRTRAGGSTTVLARSYSS